MNWIKTHPSIIINTFLALLPIPLAYLASSLGRKSSKRKLVFYLSTLLWLAFLPYALYPFAEWHHFFDGTLPNLSFNLAIVPLLKVIGRIAFFACYSGIGVLSFVFSIRLMQQVIKGQVLRWILAVPLFLLVSAALYVGLFLRYNNWDAFLKPERLLHDITATATDPVKVKLIVGFAVFAWVLHGVVNTWFDGIALRIKKFKS